MLGWPWDWETLARFAVLEGTLFALLTGGALAVRCLAFRAAPRAFASWAMWMVLVLPPAYYVIIAQAATDNLVELVRGDASAWACLALALWMFLLGAQGSMLAARSMLLRTLPARIAIVVLLVPIGFALLVAGTDPALDKYGAQFSALQFLLSRDREHYAEPLELLVRYAIFHAALVAALSFAQRTAFVSKIDQFPKNLPVLRRL